MISFPTHLLSIPVILSHAAAVGNCITIERILNEILH